MYRTIEELTEIAYTAYCDTLEWKAWNGSKLPPWDEFIIDPNKEKQAEAWRKAISSVINAKILR